MKRTTAPALLALACLLAVPSIAHARYRDGMNLYQYVQARPTSSTDPLGLAPVPIINGHPIDTWYTVPEYRYNEDGSIIVDARGRPREFPSGIEQMEQLYWTRVRVTPTTTRDGIRFPPRPYSMRVVRKCHVVIELAHTFIAERGPMQGQGTFGLAAYGHLSCFADSPLHHLNYAEEDVYSDYTPGVGDYGEVVGTEVVRQPGAIEDFPRQLGFIGPGVRATHEHGNADMGAGRPGFNRLLTAAWSAAIAQGNKFAEDCKCVCDKVTVVFVCAGPDAKRSAKAYCGKKKTIPCKKNAKSSAK